jgi:hypothetical protein
LQAAAVFDRQPLAASKQDSDMTDRTASFPPNPTSPSAPGRLPALFHTGD